MVVIIEALKAIFTSPTVIGILIPVAIYALEIMLKKIAEKNQKEMNSYSAA